MVTNALLDGDQVVVVVLVVQPAAVLVVEMTLAGRWRRARQVQHLVFDAAPRARVHFVGARVVLGLVR